MITWGISANSHDAAISVMVNDLLVFASHSERFSRIKHDPHLCQEIVDYAMQWGKPDRVIWYENPFQKTLRQFVAGQGIKWSENSVKRYLKQWGISAPVYYTNHHLSHAAAGYYTSKFDNACVVVIDSIGEWSTLSIWEGKGVSLKLKYTEKYPNSIGLWYTAMTERIGLQPLNDEYILMGMAAYGVPSYTHAIETDLITPNQGTLFTCHKNFHYGCNDWLVGLPEAEFFNVAASTQEVYERILVKVLTHAASITSSKNLVLMGGCALNCSANRLTGEIFDQVWIMPNPGDAGSSLGAILAHRKSHIEFKSPYLGYYIPSVTPNAEIVNYLLEHKICGIARGNAEFGPRALGNRSLIADPRGPEIKDRVNEIKCRQRFRPFAPAILEEHVHDYFVMPPRWETSHYMQVTAKCRQPALYPAIVHADNTSRVQTVPANGSNFRLLLEEWYQKTGCPMLLNTSLNVKGQPIVNTLNDAAEFQATYNVKVFS